MERIFYRKTIKKYSITFSKKSKGKINKIVFKIKAFHYKKSIRKQYEESLFKALLKYEKSKQNFIINTYARNTPLLSLFNGPN